MASIEGFSKFISAKYNYKETSVQDAKSRRRRSSHPILDEDGPIEAKVTVETSPDGSEVVEQTIKKG